MTHLLEELKRLEKEATKDWHRSKEYSHDYYHEGWTIYDRTRRSGIVGCCIESQENADLIVATRNSLPKLIAALEEAMGALEMLGIHSAPMSGGEFARNALSRIREHLENE